MQAFFYPSCPEKITKSSGRVFKPLKPNTIFSFWLTIFTFNCISQLLLSKFISLYNLTTPSHLSLLIPPHIAPLTR